MSNNSHTEFDEGPSPEDIERFGAETINCSSCGKEVYDEASICPACLEPLTSGKRSHRLSRWIVGSILMVLLLGYILARM
jgi:hypothetical protein